MSCKMPLPWYHRSMTNLFGRSINRIGAVVVIAVAVGSILPYLAFADEAPIRDVEGLIALAERIAGWTARIFWAVAVIAVLYSGYLFLTAGGDAEKVTKARKQLLYAVIAMAIGVMAFGFPALVESILKGR